VANDADATAMGFVDSDAYQRRGHVLVDLNEIDAGMRLPRDFLANLALIRRGRVDGVAHRLDSQNTADSEKSRAHHFQRQTSQVNA
jgi:hypothetical protein